MLFRARDTEPQTYSSKQVSTIFHDLITPVTLQVLDQEGILPPSYYLQPQAPGRVITRAEYQSLLRSRSARAPARRYSYEDLVWISLFLYIIAGLREQNVPKPQKRAEPVVKRLRELAVGQAPPRWRLLFHAQDVYVVREKEIVESLTAGSQLAFRQVIAGDAYGDVQGRIEALVAHKIIQDDLVTLGGPIDANDALEA